MLSLALLAGVGPVSADVTTERGSSILIFPKVQFDSTGLLTGEPVDTIIQISNTSNSMVFAHCYYINAAPADPTRPVGPSNQPLWQEINFDIWLTKQQPTHWVVGNGRRENPTDPLCDRTNRDCSDAGFDPGLIPLTPDPFIGELRCVEVDSSGAPINGNHLKGEATLVSPVSGESSKYNAVGVMGLNTDTNSNNSDAVLCLGGGNTPGCPNGAEYEACPQTVIMNHYAEGATNPVSEELGNGPSQVWTELTMVPCSQDLENQAPATVTVQLRMTNEFEDLFSASTQVTCWENMRLSDIAFRVFDLGTLGSRFVQTHMTAIDGAPGFVGVVEEFHQQGGGHISRTALNLHGEGARSAGDVVVMQEGR